MDPGNPFAALLSPLLETPKVDKNQKDTNNDFSDLSEKVFQLTLAKEKSAKYFYLKDVAESLEKETFDEASLNQAVLDFLVSTDNSIVDYLYHCYERLSAIKENTENFETTLFSNLYLAFTEPELFPEQNVIQDFIRIFSLPDDSMLKRFLTSFAEFCTTQEKNISQVFNQLFHHLKETLKLEHLLLGNKDHYSLIIIMSTVPLLANSMVSSSILNENQANKGRDCENTLLGSLFVSSCIPHHPGATSDFFDKPSQSPVSVHQTVEGNIWTALENKASVVHKIFYNLLKVSPDVNGLLRTWIGQVLTLNKSRGQTWSQHNIGLPNTDCASDGFMANLSAVLLHLTRPICSTSDPKSLERLTKIDPTYCSMSYNPKSGVHLSNLDKETFLTSLDNRPSPKTLPFTFISEIFFFAHRSIELGTKTLHNQLVQLGQSLNKLQRAHQDASQSGQSAVAQEIQERMDAMMSSYLSIKAALLVPEWLNMQYDLAVSTSRWLSAIALNTDPSSIVSGSVTPDSDCTSDYLSCIPEFVISNIMDYIQFLSRFSQSTLDTVKLDDFLTVVIVLMGSPHRLKNPHMRAGLAELLGCLVPSDELSHRTHLFSRHPLAKHLVGTLLHVFASIEMTGQGVRFEEKFNYRRPMYSTMKFLWGIELHKNQFKALALEAESNMEAAAPPRFLQFVNLLMNDAIYLLDEGLSYMAQMKEQQQQRAGGTWPNVPAGRQRHERESQYQHITMLARFHNLMGKETIRTLAMMTSEIKGIFVHSTVVDRVASMLNYFLLHLVGPKRKDFAVKDMQDFEFDPRDLVMNICKIYCHLGDVDKFCSAVSSDGRSYNPQLFVQAEQVLGKIGQGVLIGDLRTVAERVAERATAQEADDDLNSKAPEEFLDPIMSTLMLNPVTLPSSKVNIDRSTIARHLLSDQTDPFNRSPLTMEQVVPNDELRERIHRWMVEMKGTKDVAEQ